MRSALVLVAILLINPIAVGAEEVTLLDGALRVTIPGGYSRLTPQEVSTKFPRNNRPPFAAFADQRRNGTIAFTISKQNRPFSEEQLPEFLAAMEQLLPRMLPGLKWHKREIVTFRGRKWARMHLSAHAIDTDIKNDMYFTPFRGDILGVNMTATEALWETAAPVLLSAFRSIRVQERAP